MRNGSIMGSIKSFLGRSLRKPVSHAHYLVKSHHILPQAENGDADPAEACGSDVKMRSRGVRTATTPTTPASEARKRKRYLPTRAVPVPFVIEEESEASSDGDEGPSSDVAAVREADHSPRRVLGHVIVQEEDSASTSESDPESKPTPGAPSVVTAGSLCPDHVGHSQASQSCHAHAEEVCCPVACDVDAYTLIRITGAGQPTLSQRLKHRGISVMKKCDCIDVAR